MLNLSRMKRIPEMDGENLTLTVETGMPLMSTDFSAGSPGEKSASSGGSISTNAGGFSEPYPAHAASGGGRSSADTESVM